MGGYFYDEARDLVAEVYLAHPRKTGLIAEARIKTDEIDSETLAHLLRAGPDSQSIFSVF